MNNHLTITIQSLITTYPNYNKEDILVLKALSPYAEPESFYLINQFLNNYSDSTLTQLVTILTVLNDQLTPA